MNTTTEKSPEIILRNYDWEHAGHTTTLNGKEVKFFLSPKHPDKLLKLYPKLNGFMISHKGNTLRRNGLKYSGMDGRTGAIIPFTKISDLEEKLKFFDEAYK
ncbi:hypothetical protein DC498_17670 [Terrimonas sp.]|uniref:hypothetical protein n=1 Tax=Terrimonas sp. TaxID=1914338 RepID=UPI000D50BFE8|nr:hypothetical protein [Terrimonas sp.]PVD50801.1 hypothetical protein DC498_17670 [Terrimonas sp.]